MGGVISVLRIFSKRCDRVRVRERLIPITMTTMYRLPMLIDPFIPVQLPTCMYKVKPIIERGSVIHGTKRSPTATNGEGPKCSSGALLSRLRDLGERTSQVQMALLKPHQQGGPTLAGSGKAVKQENKVDAAKTEKSASPKQANVQLKANDISGCLVMDPNSVPSWLPALLRLVQSSHPSLAVRVHWHNSTPPIKMKFRVEDLGSNDATMTIFVVLKKGSQLSLSTPSLSGPVMGETAVMRFICRLVPEMDSGSLPLEASLLAASMLDLPSAESAASLLAHTNNGLAGTSKPTDADWAIYAFGLAPSKSQHLEQMKPFL